MNRHEPLYAFVSVLIFSTALTGCATSSKSGSGGDHGDATITATLQKRLRDDPETAPPNSIHVQTSNHVVYLSGTAYTRSVKEKAEADAREIAGVTDVVNTIVGHTP
jgi:osmotically-inducible protein OsmY